MLGENNSLGEEVRNVQEKLRLSAGTLSKLQAEFKSVCMENDEYKKRLNEYEHGIKKISTDSESKIALLSQ